MSFYFEGITQTGSLETKCSGEIFEPKQVKVSEKFIILRNENDVIYRCQYFQNSEIYKIMMGWE